jgi:hypothetical protein
MFVLKFQAFGMRLLSRLALEPQVDSRPIVNLLVENVLAYPDLFLFTPQISDFHQGNQASALGALLDITMVIVRNQDISNDAEPKEWLQSWGCFFDYKALTT